MFARRFLSAGRILRETARFPGAKDSEIVHKLNFLTEFSAIPTYRVLNTQGVVVGQDPQVSPLFYTIH